MENRKTVGAYTFRTFVYIVCIILGLMSIYPFFVMFLNSTRSSIEIQAQAIPFVPSSYFSLNLEVLQKSAQFNAITGFKNSLIIAVGSVFCAIYFSCMTAYALVAYSWKLRQPFFTFIMAVMMIPGQIVTIGFYTMVWQLGFIDNFLPLILPAVASPTIVFFMRQYLISTFSIDIVNAARIDGSGEFGIFNKIVLPIMKPAIATQTIFVFVGSWNAFFLPRVLLTSDKNFTMPIMVSLLRGNIYNTEYGAIYLGIALSVIPIFIMYFSLSRYIVAGIQLGGVKE